jgi:hypothetical protein
LASPPADAWMAWLIGQARDAGLAPLPGSVGPSRSAGAVVRVGRGRAGPFRGDDGVELGPQQLLISAQQLNELLVRARRGIHAVGVQDPGHYSHPRQALIACRSSPLLVMEILRGLACSATGICKVSTPLS